MGYGSNDMYLSKKPKGKWSKTRIEQRKQKMFGDDYNGSVQQWVDVITMPLKVEQAKQRGEKV